MSSPASVPHAFIDMNIECRWQRNAVDGDAEEEDSGGWAFTGAVQSRYISPTKLCTVVVAVDVPEGRDQWDFNNDNFEALAGAKFAEWEKLNPTFKACSSTGGVIGWGRAPFGEWSKPTRDTFVITTGDDRRTAIVQKIATIMGPYMKVPCYYSLTDTIQGMLLDCAKGCDDGGKPCLQPCVRSVQRVMQFTLGSLMTISKEEMVVIVLDRLFASDYKEPPPPQSAKRARDEEDE